MSTNKLGVSTRMIRSAATRAAGTIADLSVEFRRADFLSCLELRCAIIYESPYGRTYLSTPAADRVAAEYAELFGPVPGCTSGKKWLNEHGSQHGINSARKRNEWRITALLLFAAMHDPS